MSRASADIRPVSLSAPELVTNAWSLWTTVEEWTQSFNEMQAVFYMYAQFVGVACFIFLFLLLGGRWMLRRSRIRHYSQGK